MNSVKGETTSCGTCRRQITKMASQSRSKPEIVITRRKKISVNFKDKTHVFRLQIAMNIDIKKPRQQQIQAKCP